MGCLGNIIWILCGGLLSSIGWVISGVLWCITIIGIPIGVQCFKFAALSLAPFGKKITIGTRFDSIVLNIFWIILTGVPMAVINALCGVILCITIIGIPFGIQFFKLAQLSLLPFGAKIE